MVNTKRILLVEDDPDGQALVTHILQYLRMPIDVANDAEQALQLLQDSSHYRAVIIDLALPGRDGWDLLSEIQTNGEISDLPCIAVTAFHTSKTREEALRAGFDAYFPKPIQVNSFAKELEALLSA